MPAAFSAATSPRPEASGSAGPLTVVRLLRTVLLFLAVFAGRDDLAMYGLLLPRNFLVVRRGTHRRVQHFAYQDDSSAPHLLEIAIRSGATVEKCAVIATRGVQI